MIMAYNAIDIAKKIICKTDVEHGDTLSSFERITLSENMKEAVRKAVQSLAEGDCLTEEMFQTRFAKWL